MRFAAATVLATLPLLATAAPAADNCQHQPKIDYDAIIVGGGPAGLSALSGLARVRRNVLLIDSGVYRNGATRHMHDVIGLDGLQPAYYRWAARQQLSHYDTITMTNGTVCQITPQQNNTYFAVQGVYGNTAGTYTARKIVLATGMKDLIPSTPGLQENWGKGIYWCPWCDGIEHADQPLGLIGPLSSMILTVEEILTLNKDLIIFTNGTDTAAVREETEKKHPNWQKFLQIHNVQIENRTIAAVERLRDGYDPSADPSLPTHPEYDLFRVVFTDGGSTLRAAFLTSFKSEQASNVGKDMGVKMLGNKMGVDDDEGLVTSIPGVFAVGDCNSDNSTNVPHALYTGKRAAVHLHIELAGENSEQELAELTNTRKRGVDMYARSLWDRMNGDADDLLHAGPFDQ